MAKNADIVKNAVIMKSFFRHSSSIDHCCYWALPKKLLHCCYWALPKKLLHCRFYEAIGSLDIVLSKSCSIPRLIISYKTDVYAPRYPPLQFVDIHFQQKTIHPLDIIFLGKPILEPRLLYGIRHFLIS